MKIINLILAITILISCGVPKDDYEKVVEERDSLKLELEGLKVINDKNINDNLLLEKELQAYREKERQENEVPYVTETRALEVLKYDYSFNRRDDVYKDVQIMRLAKNKFRISLMEKSRTAPERSDDFFYHNKKLVLTIFKGDKYTLTSSW
ncbi:hypothetical protein [Gilvibacter sediminis]|uniref:hypothetical protein n=1 Tax=Gilvibacter sediminis TaxID=379071 RepID=UPI00234FB800|nr:hypothetical protein [Gilvibacter sediminis]MDC7997974.1 hypothetical protein [Gilvibacter sediminis]